MAEHWLNKVTTDYDEYTHTKVYKCDTLIDLANQYKVLWYDMVIDNDFKITCTLKGMDRDLIEFKNGCETVVLELPAGLINH